MTSIQAQEYKSNSSELLVSLSVDDIAIRKLIEMKRVGEIAGYPDLGDCDGPVFVDLGGGKTATPATHAMVFMVTALNGSFKVPCGYVIINEKFNGKGNIIMIFYRWVTIKL